MHKKRVIIVGAGPAGLTAAWEMIKTGHDVTVLERDPKYVGGLAKTLSYKGFRFDIGAHRFFSKNPEINKWWRERLPKDFIRIKRQTRILYRQRFFHYPLRAVEVIVGLGPGTSLACLLSYLWRQVFLLKPEVSFEDWVRNRFGDKLYEIFFRTYTEKVWGMPCSKINSDWASQRIKGFSFKEAIMGAFGWHQKSVKTLIDEFDYPRCGAGMMWERARDEIVEKGARVYMGRTVVRIEYEREHIVSLQTSSVAGKLEDWPADVFIISMPLRDCITCMTPPLGKPVLEAANKLRYRDLILVAVIVSRANLFPDNWIYIHDPSVKVGRIGNYNNWTSGMIFDPQATCLEMEYFCSQGDAFWETDDSTLLELAKQELVQLGLAKISEIRDGCVVRVEKAYPVYDVDYQETVKVIRGSLAHFENLEVVGRNGMHKYNNQDHSMLTGMLAARNFSDKQYNVWQVNTDAEYHEESPAVKKKGMNPSQPACSSSCDED